MKNIIILCCLLFFFSDGFGQKKGKQITTLYIGDKVPDIILGNMLNGKSRIAKLSDYQDKVIILDFWATWCTACLGKFQKLDSLQREFRDKIAIVLVTQDSRKDAEKLLEKQYRKNGYRYVLPSVTGDTTMVRLFPHRLIPHYVWIYKNRIIAFTSSSEVTAANIASVYSGNTVKWRMKNDILDYERAKPIFVNGNGGNGENILYRSILTGYTDGLNTGYTQDVKDGLFTRLLIRNETLPHLYMQAYGKRFAKSRIVYEVKDPGKFVNTNKDENWDYDNLYSYEIIVPPMTREMIAARMRIDLATAFPYTSSVQTRKVKCLVLVRDSAGIVAKSGAPSEAGEIKKFSNSSHLASLIESILNVTVIDEISAATPIEMPMPRPPVREGDLQSVLKAAGFYLKESEREIEVFVITEPETDIRAN